MLKIPEVVRFAFVCLGFSFPAHGFLSKKKRGGKKEKVIPVLTKNNDCLERNPTEDAGIGKYPGKRLKDANAHGFG